jgi:hypothetical protein
MPRLEDKIRNLCARALVTRDDKELKSQLDELRDALHQHIERLRGRLFAYPFVLERRKQDGTPPLDGASAPTAASTVEMAKAGPKHARDRARQR